MTPNYLLIKGGTIFTEDKTIFNMDVLIEDSKIAMIDLNIPEPENCDIIDAKGMYLIPGLVDMNCEICEPGYDFRESFETAGYSAIAGGYTALTCSPMTNPIIDNKTVVEYVVNRAMTVCPVSVYPYGALTVANEGKQVTEIGEMQLRGIVAASDGHQSIQDSKVIQTVFRYASMFDMPIILHCEDHQLSNGNGINEGFIATQLGLIGSTISSETNMLAKYIAIAEEADAKLHISHVSTARSVEMIRSAKKRGLSITAETSPHYFSLSEEAVLGYNTYAKVNPPLRKEEDVKAIIKGIKDGTIDVISSDHQPHNVDSKEIEFSLASNGISSLETALSISYTHLVEPEHIDMETLVKKMSSKPADILTISKNRISVGSYADLAIFDPEASYEVDATKFSSKAKHSPYHGKTLKGLMKYTIVNGKKHVVNL